MQLFKRFIYAVNDNALKVSMLVVLFLMLLTVTDVLGRYFFNKPVPGTFELTRIALAIIVFVSLGYGQIQKINVSIAVLFSKLPLTLRNVLQCFNYLVSLVLFSLVCWQMFKYAGRLAAAGQFTTVLRLPMHPWIIIAAVGSLLLCLVFLLDLIDAVKNLVQRRDEADEQ